MSLWIQHGYGKGRKFEQLLDTGSLGGVILSPADERYPALERTVGVLSDEVEVLLDPQTYVWSIPDGGAPRHEDLGLAIPRLDWSMPPDDIQAVVRSVIALNERLELPRILSPTCLQRALGDVWTSLAIQFARETTSQVDPSRVLVSVVMDEAALADWDAAERWLDVLTSIDVAGFYLIVARPANSYLRSWDSVKLTNLLRLVYRLGVLNEFEVLIGYSDIDGLTSVACGASGIASGWYQTLRFFSAAKWQPSQGGGQARPRVTSTTLMTPLLVDEAGQLARSTFASQAFPDEGLRSLLASRPEAWGLSQSWVQHLAALRELVRSVEARGPIPSRIQYVGQLVEAAITALGDIQRAGLVWAGQYAGRLRALQDALGSLAQSESI